MDIIQLGNPQLRDIAQPLSPDILKSHRAFFQDLQETMAFHNGVGIAAPQVGKSVRAFIVASKPNSRYPDAPKMEPTLVINPELVWHSEETALDWEGCLSIPGIRAKVPRSVSIAVRYMTLEGEYVECRFDGFIARIFQHELDHLNGVVFLDRADSRNFATEAEYLKQLSANR
ncbi:peptide deformylase [Parasalinivibrio latis]|uniref:peptide deformylase n=1 Tax=Parasalinivibrio latis TaxID=2952610 RepID=UPI0030E488B4